MRDKRVRAYRQDLFAEAVAALLLRLKGHRILARRYKTPVGEIDFVALKGAAGLRRGQAAQAFRGYELGVAQAGEAPHGPGRAIFAEQPSGFCRPRHCFRRGAGSALGPGRTISRTHFLFDLASPLARASPPHRA
ncbi:MAG: YraN family protein [Methyloceanibacter sp.]